MVHLPAEPELTALTEPDDDDAPEKRIAVISRKLHGVRLDKALVSIAGEFSRSHLQSLIDQGHVWVDGLPANSASRKVLAGQQITLELVPTPENLAFRPEPLDLNIVFEDQHLMVINKPAGMVVHPAAGNWSGTLLNGVLEHYAAAATLPRAGIVHRLDKDTSGLLVVGKTLQAVTSLVRAIASREVHREYMALVHGHLGLASFRVDAPLARDPQSRVRMAVAPSGKTAQTDVTCIAVAETADGPVSAVRCKLLTGRTHQIRVHLASRGYPLLGDAIYGGRPALGLMRQALHATKLGLEHPEKGEMLWFDAEPPRDLSQAWHLVNIRRDMT